MKDWEVKKMKVMAREGAWASSYFRTAIKHCIEADKLLARIRATDDLSQHMAIDELMNDAGAITIVFSAMCVEAYMNDYLAQKMGRRQFLKHYEGISLPIMPEYRPTT